MFIGKYTIYNETYSYIYYKNKYGYEQWFKDTCNMNVSDIEILDLSVKGKTYAEKKAYAEELAKDYQYNFACLNWSYGELYEIGNFFETIGKRYGLLKEFKENAIC